jgi:hypothetical protein
LGKIADSVEIAGGTMIMFGFILLVAGGAISLLAYGSWKTGYTCCSPLEFLGPFAWPLIWIGLLIFIIGWPVAYLARHTASEQVPDN